MQTVILIVLLIVMIIYQILFQKQVKNIAEQLRFHKNEDSNVEIGTALRNKSITSLQTELNELLVQKRNQQISYEKKEEAVMNMVTDISHDIRTPLTSIQGYFQMLEDCETDEEREHYKDIIKKRLKTLNVMLDDFFTYSKLMQKKQEDSQEESHELCDVRQILCESLFLYYDDLISKHINVTLDIPEKRFERCLNKEQLNRIFMNLLKNILIHGYKELQVSMKNDNEKICILLENQTVETLPQNLANVFERFYKGDQARSSQAGTGLGLCIVKELADQMGLEVEAFSRGAGWFGIMIKL